MKSKIITPGMFKNALVCGAGVAILGFALHNLRGNKVADQIRAGFN